MALAVGLYSMGMLSSQVLRCVATACLARKFVQSSLKMPPPKDGISVPVAKHLGKQLPQAYSYQHFLVQKKCTANHPKQGSFFHPIYAV
eukprot:316054-Amphidinium_carterae.2